MADSAERFISIVRKVIFADGEHKFAVHEHMFAGGEHKFMGHEYKIISVITKKGALCGKCSLLY